MNSDKLSYKVKIGDPMLLGATKVKDGINFAVLISNNDRPRCSIVFYEKGTRKIVFEIPFTENMMFGKVYAMVVSGIKIGDFDYNYRIGKEIVTDPYAKLINGSGVFGENCREIKTSSVFMDKFKWDNDERPLISFSDTIIYRLHVRGFTMHRFSKVRKKGTFGGIIEKIDYLKSLGITMVELMPAYDFNEKGTEKNKRVNYWGYTDSDYMMPKVSYSNTKTPKGAIHEFKTMVKELHKNGIEVCMEFCFDKNITPTYMIDCFRYWVINYHIDGIHCNMSDDIRGAISADPYLSDVKIISLGFDNDDFSREKHLGECNRVFMNTARKFLKGDEGQVMDMAYRVRYNKKYAQQINYIANNDTFTLMDMVSYDGKHNESNGEYNRDGIEDNNSWNCGFEGVTKKQNVIKLRRRQIKNALSFVMLSQGAPLIYAGDEFGNSCNGNNNPYCQDNEVSYLDWRLTKKNEDILEFFKFLVKFRKERKVLHLDAPLEGNDYYSLGMPDISYHSDRTWILLFDVLSRQFAYMLNGRYPRAFHKPEEENLYIAYNMHWEEKKLGLPLAGKNKEWKQVFSTDEDYYAVIDNGKMKIARTVKVPPRSVLVLESKDIEEEDNVEIILASQSPRRKDILTNAGISFTTKVSDKEEKVSSDIPEEVVKELSNQKALDVLEKSEEIKNKLIIGADTVVSCDNKILGKPKNAGDARKMLSMIQGKKHEVYTGVTIIYAIGDKIKKEVFAEKTEVFVRKINKKQIDEYIKTKEPMDKAGAYAIQGIFGKYIEKIEGDYNNVVGLPIDRVLKEVRDKFKLNLYKNN